MSADITTALALFALIAAAVWVGRRFGEGP